MKSSAADAAQPNKTTAAITARYRLADRFMQNKGIAAGAL